MSEFSYIIDDNNTIFIYRLSQQPEPIIYQPNYPNNTPFENREAAEKWAQECIYNLENPQPDENLDNAI